MNKEEREERLLKFLQNYNKALREKLATTALYRDNIIKFGDLQYMYIAASLASFNRNYEDLTAYENAVLKSNNFYYHYMFAKNIKNVNTKAFEEAILSKGDSKTCYLFAKDVKNADIKALEKRVIESKNAKVCCMFAEDIVGADVLALQNVVMQSKNIGLCEYFLGIKGADKNALNECINSILQNKNKCK